MAAPAQASSSSLRQQHEERSLQEAATAAERGHEPVGAEAGVSADHALEHIRLGGKRGQSVREWREEGAVREWSGEGAACAPPPPGVSHVA